MADAATDAQIEAQARLRALVAEGVRQTWRALPSHDEESVAPWLAIVVPLVAAAMRTSVALSDAYVARLLGRRPLGIDPAPVLGAVRGAAALEAVYRRPFVQTWVMLSEGKPFAEAVAAGEARAMVRAELDVQLAHRAAMDAIQTVDPHIFGFARAADPNACSYCKLLDRAYVKRADALAMHARCGCGLEPLTGPHPRAAKLPDGTPVSALTLQDEVEGVATWRHGEYGATLGDPGHDHLTPAEALAR